LVMPNIPAMAIAILIAGLAISATLIGAYTVAQTLVPAEQRTEAMSWLTTGASLGTALGAPIAGHVIDTYGATGGYAFALAAGILAIATTTLHQQHLSD
jgi:predicted MFS family arabinose efflux permease